MWNQIESSAKVAGKNSTINLKIPYAPIPIIAGDNRALIGVGAEP